MVGTYVFGVYGSPYTSWYDDALLPMDPAVMLSGGLVGGMGSIEEWGMGRTLESWGTRVWWLVPGW